MSPEKRKHRSARKSDSAAPLSLVNTMIDLKVKLLAYRARTEAAADIGPELRDVLELNNLAGNVTVVFAPAGKDKPTLREIEDLQEPSHSRGSNANRTHLSRVNRAFYEVNNHYSCKHLLYWLSRIGLVPLRIATVRSAKNSVAVTPFDPRLVHPRSTSLRSTQLPPPLVLALSPGATYDSLCASLDRDLSADATVQCINEFVASYVVTDAIDTWQDALAAYWSRHPDKHGLQGEDPSLANFCKPSITQVESAVRQFILLGAYAHYNSYKQIDYLLSPGVDGQHKDRSTTIVCWTKFDQHTISDRARFSLSLQSTLHLPDQNVLKEVLSKQETLQRMKGGLGAAHAIGQWIKRVDYAVDQELNAIGELASERSLSESDRAQLDQVKAAVKRSSENIQKLTQRIEELSRLTHLSAQLLAYRNAIPPELAGRLGSDHSYSLGRFVTETIEEWFPDGAFLSRDGDAVRLVSNARDVDPDIVLRGRVQDTNGTWYHVKDFVYRTVLAELLVNAVRSSKALSTAEAEVKLTIIPTASKHCRNGALLPPDSWSLEVSNDCVLKDGWGTAPRLDGQWSTGGIQFVGALLREIQCGYLREVVLPHDDGLHGVYVSTLVDIGTRIRSRP